MQTSFTMLLLAVLLFAGIDVSGQSFSLVSAPSLSDKESPYAAYNDRPERHMCAVHIIGLSAMGVGTIASGVGLSIVYLALDPKNNISPNTFDLGAYLFLGAGVLFNIGLGMTIGGTIHDRRLRRLNRWSIITPKNRFGLAYNF